MVNKVIVFIATVIIMLMSAKTNAGVSLIFNGSFENDGRQIAPITALDMPEDWNDIDFMDGKFSGQSFESQTSFPSINIIALRKFGSQAPKEVLNLRSKIIFVASVR